MITSLWHRPATIERNNFIHKSLSCWAYNVAVGCNHACRFCYVPEASTNRMAAVLATKGVQDPDAGWGEYVFPRCWDKAAFMRSLTAAEKTPNQELNADGNRAVMLCTTTDPYQIISRGAHAPPRVPADATSAGPEVSRVARETTPGAGVLPDLNDQMRVLVREALELMLACPMNGWLPLNVRILTRSPLARRDFDLMKSFGKRLLFGMSLPTLNNKLARIYEPKAPAPTQRLETLRAAKAAGLNVYVAVAPAYPECDTADLAATLTAVKELDPVTIFFEPINIRADNVKRIHGEHTRPRVLGDAPRVAPGEGEATDGASVATRAGACAPPITLNTEVFSTPERWREYALNQLVVFEVLAKKLGIADTVLHLWPDKSLASQSSLAQFQRAGRDILPWLNHHWNKISQWPK